MINAERWAQVENLYNDLVDLSLNDREVRLATVTDEDLRREVISLIQAGPLSSEIAAWFKAERGRVFAKLAQDKARVDGIGPCSDACQSGDLLAERYLIIEFLGRGGMGEVYAAEDQDLGERIALKVIRSEVALDKTWADRFRREVLLARRVTHPNVCRVFDLERHRQKDREIVFLTMELVRGETLAVRLKRGGPLSISDALPVAIQLCSALDAAHQASILHRDLKCGNVILAESGTQVRAVVTDFGTARPMDSVPNPITTATNAILGTPAYMSPEQLAGKDLSTASDIYSLGLVLYEMVTGTRPFQAGSPWCEAMRRLSEDPEPPLKIFPGLGGSWNTTILRCLERSPEKRFSSAQAVADSLSPMSDSHASTAHSGQYVDRPSRSARPAQRLIRTWVALVAACLVLVAGWSVWNFKTGSRSQIPHADHPIQSIVVLPFANLSGDPNQEYLADGMTDALITDLAKIGSFRVISRTSAMHYKGSQKRLPEIARELSNVDAVVEGSVVRSGTRVSLTAQLVLAASDQHIWADRYERDFGEIVAMQRDLASAVTRQIAAELVGQQGTNFKRVNPEAEEAYLRGRFQLSQDTLEGSQLALEYFKEAAEKDPGSALAFAGVADAESRLAMSGLQSAKFLGLARAAAQRSLQLDENVADAHSLLGLAKVYLDRDWDGAELEFKRALQLSPGDGSVHLLYSTAYLTPLGRHAEAIIEARRALKSDPLSPRVNANLGWQFLLARQYDEAIEQFRKTLQLDSDFAGALHGLMEIYEQQNLYAQAVPAFQQHETSADASPEFIQSISKAYARDGMAGYWRKRREAWLLDLKHGFGLTSELAIICARSGQVDKAFQLLQQANSERDIRMIMLNVDGEFDPLRSDLRFDELRKHLRLPSQ